MALCFRRTCGLLFFLSAVSVRGEQGATVIQPGAPGEDSKTVSAATVRTAVRTPAEADTSFMQGMIMHHSQAVEMTALMAARTHNKALLNMGKRISISQTDEIQYMKQWLQERGKPTTMEMDMSGMDMKDMKHMDMSMPLMPGMLSPEQMKALAKATGPRFDYLFLTGMIQHHTGALTMVKDLFDTPGAAQDPILFDFATDIDNTQRAEIRIMQNMLPPNTQPKEKK